MVVGVSVFELHLPECRSLKQKRKVVKGLVDRLHARFKISIAEVEHHDLHQRAGIGMALVAQGEGDALRLFDRIRGVMDDSLECMVLGWDPEILEML